MSRRVRLVTGKCITLHCDCPGSSIDDFFAYATGYTRLEGLVAQLTSKCPKCGLHSWLDEKEYPLYLKAIQLERSK